MAYTSDFERRYITSCHNTIRWSMTRFPYLTNIKRSSSYTRIGERYAKRKTSRESITQGKPSFSKQEVRGRAVTLLNCDVSLEKNSSEQRGDRKQIHSGKTKSLTTIADKKFLPRRSISKSVKPSVDNSIVKRSQELVQQSNAQKFRSLEKFGKTIKLKSNYKVWSVQDPWEQPKVDTEKVKLRARMFGKNNGIWEKVATDKADSAFVQFQEMMEAPGSINMDQYLHEQELRRRSKPKPVRRRTVNVFKVSDPYVRQRLQKNKVNLEIYNQMHLLNEREPQCEFAEVQCGRKKLYIAFLEDALTDAGTDKLPEKVDKAVPAPAKPAQTLPDKLMKMTPGKLAKMTPEKIVKMIQEKPMKGGTFVKMVRDRPAAGPGKSRLPGRDRPLTLKFPQKSKDYKVVVNLKKDCKEMPACPTIHLEQKTPEGEKTMRFQVRKMEKYWFPTDNGKVKIQYLSGVLTNIKNRIKEKMELPKLLKYPLVVPEETKVVLFEKGQEAKQPPPSKPPPEEVAPQPSGNENERPKGSIVKKFKLLTPKKEEIPAEIKKETERKYLFKVLRRKGRKVANESRDEKKLIETRLDNNVSKTFSRFDNLLQGLSKPRLEMKEEPKNKPLPEVELKPEDRLPLMKDETTEPPQEPPKIIAPEETAQLQAPKKIAPEMTLEEKSPLPQPKAKTVRPAWKQIEKINKERQAELSKVRAPQSVDLFFTQVNRQKVKQKTMQENSERFRAEPEMTENQLVLPEQVTPRNPPAQGVLSQEGQPPPWTPHQDAHYQQHQQQMSIQASYAPREEAQLSLQPPYQTPQAYLQPYQGSPNAAYPPTPHEGWNTQYQMQQPAAVGPYQQGYPGSSPTYERWGYPVEEHNQPNTQWYQQSAPVQGNAWNQEMYRNQQWGQQEMYNGQGNHTQQRLLPPSLQPPQQWNQHGMQPSQQGMDTYREPESVPQSFPQAPQQWSQQGNQTYQQGYNTPVRSSESAQPQALTQWNQQGSQTNQHGFQDQGIAPQQRNQPQSPQEPQQWNQTETKSSQQWNQSNETTTPGQEGQSQSGKTDFYYPELKNQRRRLPKADQRTGQSGQTVQFTSLHERQHHFFPIHVEVPSSFMEKDIQMYDLQNQLEETISKPLHKDVSVHEAEKILREDLPDHLPESILNKWDDKNWDVREDWDAEAKKVPNLRKLVRAKSASATDCVHSFIIETDTLGECYNTCKDLPEFTPRTAVEYNFKYDQEPEMRTFENVVAQNFTKVEDLDYIELQRSEARKSKLEAAMNGSSIQPAVEEAVTVEPAPDATTANHFPQEPYHVTVSRYEVAVQDHGGPYALSLPTALDMKQLALNEVTSDTSSPEQSQSKPQQPAEAADITTSPSAGLPCAEQNAPQNEPSEALARPKSLLHVQPKSVKKTANIGSLKPNQNIQSGLGTLKNVQNFKSSATAATAMDKTNAEDIPSQIPEDASGFHVPSDKGRGEASTEGKAAEKKGEAIAEPKRSRQQTKLPESIDSPLTVTSAMKQSADETKAARSKKPERKEEPDPKVSDEIMQKLKEELSSKLKNEWKVKLFDELTDKIKPVIELKLMPEKPKNQIFLEKAKETPKTDEKPPEQKDTLAAKAKEELKEELKELKEELKKIKLKEELKQELKYELKGELTSKKDAERGPGVRAHHAVDKPVSDTGAPEKPAKEKAEDYDYYRKAAATPVMTTEGGGESLPSKGKDKAEDQYEYYRKSVAEPVMNVSASADESPQTYTLCDELEKIQELTYPTIDVSTNAPVANPLTVQMTSTDGVQSQPPSPQRTDKGSENAPPKHLPQKDHPYLPKWDNPPDREAPEYRPQPQPDPKYKDHPYLPRFDPPPPKEAPSQPYGPQTPNPQIQPSYQPYQPQTYPPNQPQTPQTYPHQPYAPTQPYTPQTYPPSHQPYQPKTNPAQPYHPQTYPASQPYSPQTTPSQPYHPQTFPSQQPYNPQTYPSTQPAPPQSPNQPQPQSPPQRRTINHPYYSSPQQPQQSSQQAQWSQEMQPSTQDTPSSDGQESQNHQQQAFHADQTTEQAAADATAAQNQEVRDPDFILQSRQKHFKILLPESKIEEDQRLDAMKSKIQEEQEAEKRKKEEEERLSKEREQKMQQQTRAKFFKNLVPMPKTEADKEYMNPEEKSAAAKPEENLDKKGEGQARKYFRTFLPDPKLQTKFLKYKEDYRKFRVPKKDDEPSPTDKPKTVKPAEIKLKELPPPKPEIKKATESKPSETPEKPIENVVNFTSSGGVTSKKTEGNTPEKVSKAPEKTKQEGNNPAPGKDNSAIEEAKQKQANDLKELENRRLQEEAAAKALEAKRKEEIARRRPGIYGYGITEVIETPKLDQQVTPVIPIPQDKGPNEPKDKKPSEEKKIKLPGPEGAKERKLAAEETKTSPPKDSVVLDTLLQKQPKTEKKDEKVTKPTPPASNADKLKRFMDEKPESGDKKVQDDKKKSAAEGGVIKKASEKIEKKILEAAVSGGIKKTVEKMNPILEWEKKLLGTDGKAKADDAKKDAEKDKKSAKSDSGAEKTSQKPGKEGTPKAAASKPAEEKPKTSDFGKRKSNLSDWEKEIGEKVTSVFRVPSEKNKASGDGQKKAGSTGIDTQKLQKADDAKPKKADEIKTKPEDARKADNPQKTDGKSIEVPKMPGDKKDGSTPVDKNPKMSFSDDSGAMQARLEQYLSVFDLPKNGGSDPGSSPPMMVTNLTTAPELDQYDTNDLHNFISAGTNSNDFNLCLSKEESEEMLRYNQKAHGTEPEVTHHQTAPPQVAYVPEATFTHPPSTPTQTDANTTQEQASLKDQAASQPENNQPQKPDQNVKVVKIVFEDGKKDMGVVVENEAKKRKHDEKTEQELKSCIEILKNVLSKAEVEQSEPKMAQETKKAPKEEPKPKKEDRDGESDLSLYMQLLKMAMNNGKNEMTQSKTVPKPDAPKDKKEVNLQPLVELLRRTVSNAESQVYAEQGEKSQKYPQTPNRDSADATQNEQLVLLLQQFRSAIDAAEAEIRNSKTGAGDAKKNSSADLQSFLQVLKEGIEKMERQEQTTSGTPAKEEPPTRLVSLGDHLPKKPTYDSSDVGGVLHNPKRHLFREKVSIGKEQTEYVIDPDVIPDKTVRMQRQETRKRTNKSKQKDADAEEDVEKREKPDRTKKGKAPIVENTTEDELEVITDRKSDKPKKKENLVELVKRMQKIEEEQSAKKGKKSAEEEAIGELKKTFQVDKIILNFKTDVEGNQAKKNREHKQEAEASGESASSDEGASGKKKKTGRRKSKASPERKEEAEEVEEGEVEEERKTNKKSKSAQRQTPGEEDALARKKDSKQMTEETSEETPRKKTDDGKRTPRKSPRQESQPEVTKAKMHDVEMMKEETTAVQYEAPAVKEVREVSPKPKRESFMDTTGSKGAAERTVKEFTIREEPFDIEPVAEPAGKPKTKKDAASKMQVPELQKQDYVNVEGHIRAARVDKSSTKDGRAGKFPRTILPDTTNVEYGKGEAVKEEEEAPMVCQPPSRPQKDLTRRSQSPRKDHSKMDEMRKAVKEESSEFEPIKFVPLKGEAKGYGKSGKKHLGSLTQKRDLQTLATVMLKKEDAETSRREPNRLIMRKLLGSRADEERPPAESVLGEALRHRIASAPFRKTDLSLTEREMSAIKDKTELKVVRVVEEPQSPSARDASAIDSHRQLLQAMAKKANEVPCAVAIDPENRVPIVHSANPPVATPTFPPEVKKSKTKYWWQKVESVKK